MYSIPAYLGAKKMYLLKNVAEMTSDMNQIRLRCVFLIEMLTPCLGS